MLFYLGTYTQRGGAGVLGCELGAENAMRVIGSVFLKDPTYVIANARRDRLFCVCEAPAEGEEGGSAASFSLGEDGAPVLLSRQNAVGRGPCHLCLSPDERFLYLANYVSGSVSVFPVEEGGRLGALLQLVQHEGHGPNAGRQQGPHAHQVVFLPQENALCCVDLGADALFTYAQDRDTGRLSLNDRFSLPAGYGPRHLAKGEGNLFYLAHELKSAVSVLRRENGQWTLLETHSTLPAPQASNTVAAVRVFEGRVMVSNRGHDSIAVFAIEGERLRPLGIFPTPGPVPRDFYPLKDGRLLIAHQEGDVTLARLAEDGFIPLSHLDVRGAVCVLPFEEEMA